jgi:hypothetical protein
MQLDASEQPIDGFLLTDEGGTANAAHPITYPAQDSVTARYHETFTHLYRRIALSYDDPYKEYSKV